VRVLPCVCVVAGDELLSDSFPYKEIENGVLWEVEGKVRLLSSALSGHSSGGIRVLSELCSVRSPNYAMLQWFLFRGQQIGLVQ